MQTTAHELACRAPKTELHLHIEGSLEPDLMMKLAQRNGIELPWDNEAEIKKAYNFSNLQSFLDIYYEGAGVLQTEEDFYDLTMAYLERAHQDRIIHTEIFFDPQTHTERGIPMGTVIHGIHRALAEGQNKFGISFEIILCFLRHLSNEEAEATLEQAKPYLKYIAGVGLDSSEFGHPPEKFERVFHKARELGLRTVAHAGEEGPAEYIVSALDCLNAERIDHGVRCLEDEALVTRLVREKIPLTVCPYSNVMLKVFPTLDKHNLVELLEKGLNVSIHSDDPAYFGGYLGENYRGVIDALDLSVGQVQQLLENAIISSWMPEHEKLGWIEEIRGLVDELSQA